jgi:hypothetical protein
VLSEVLSERKEGWLDVDAALRTDRPDRYPLSQVKVVMIAAIFEIC